MRTKYAQSEEKERIVGKLGTTRSVVEASLQYRDAFRECLVILGQNGAEHDVTSSKLRCVVQPHTEHCSLTETAHQPHAKAEFWYASCYSPSSVATPISFKQSLRI
jgi:hypothetical protein